MQPDESVLQIKSFFDPRDRWPYVVLEWGNQRTQLTGDQARRLAMQLIDCANVAEQDAFIIEFLGKENDLPAADIDNLLIKLREWRIRYREES